MEGEEAAKNFVHVHDMHRHSGEVHFAVDHSRRNLVSH